MVNVSTSGASHFLMASSIAVVGSDSSFYGELLVSLYDLRWAILFIILLVFTDFWSGIAASVKIKHQEFRFSRALRRTVAKFAEYVCFIILGCLLSKAILIPIGIENPSMGSAIGASIALIAEFDSICDHVCDLHGIKNRISFKRLLIAIIKKKNEDVGEAIEESLEDK